MTNFALDYLAFVFLSAVGVLLVVTAHSRLHGLLLVGRRLSILLGAALTVVAFTWFFTSKPRNLPDTGGGLDGNEQTLLFAVSAGAALALVLILSSVRNWSLGANAAGNGVEALRSSSYLRLLFKGMKDRWKHWNGRMKQHSSG
ncbi:MAG: hypothetical protein Q7K03_01990 [Dehalococcoidia bacterium]|nr:hypothetical protein [Dehalococcoidia bacterium]